MMLETCREELLSYWMIDLGVMTFVRASFSDRRRQLTLTENAKKE
jgi:hypothetical protein